MIKSISALSCVVLLGACATPAHVEVPANLKPGARESLLMIVPAKGVQVYECRLDKGAALQWTFVAPEAALFDGRGNTIGQHGAGPYWQATDGSRIVGALKQRADAPDPAAIAWLLLSTTSNGPDGAFSNVSSIQRVNTVGGVAPATGCVTDSTGKTARIPYTADYYFFTNR